MGVDSKQTGLWSLFSTLGKCLNKCKKSNDAWEYLTYAYNYDMQSGEKTSFPISFVQLYKDERIPMLDIEKISVFMKCWRSSVYRNLEMFDKELDKGMCGVYEATREHCRQ